MAVKTVSPTTSASVFGYSDYRQFLRDRFALLQKKQGLTLREFANKAGIKAPGYLKMVVEGKRNITLETAQGFCEALELGDKEREYFITLVGHNQSDNPDEKQKLFEKLTKEKPRSRDFKQGKKENRYFSRPYYACIREMVTLNDFKDDPQWIARRCFPNISPREAREALNTLLELGLLKRGDDGKLMQTEDFVHTADRQTDVVETYHYHEAQLDRARQALTQLGQDERNFYALTLPLHKKTYTKIIDEFYVFRDKVLKLANADAEGLEEVYQINFQIFPASKKKDVP